MKHLEQRHILTAQVHLGLMVYMAESSNPIINVYVSKFMRFQAHQMHRPTSFGLPPTTLNIQQITFTYTYLETNWIQPLIKASPETPNFIINKYL